jgi:hypothetical protein
MVRGSTQTDNPGQEFSVTTHTGVAISALLSLAAFGCAAEQEDQPGGTAEAAVAQTDFDPCALLTFVEISATVGWKPDSSVKKTYGTTGNCTYHGPNAYTQVVSVLVGQGMPDMSDSRKMADWRSAQYKESNVSDFIVEPVEGLGVPAIRNEFGVVAIEMAVRDQLVSVTSLTASFDQVRKLAGFVVARAQ